MPEFVLQKYSDYTCECFILKPRKVSHRSVPSVSHVTSPGLTTETSYRIIECRRGRICKCLLTGNYITSRRAFILFRSSLLSSRHLCSFPLSELPEASCVSGLIKACTFQTSNKFSYFFPPAAAEALNIMNIFRLAGDVSHLVAIVILLMKIWWSKSCAGMLIVTQILHFN